MRRSRSSTSRRGCGGRPHYTDDDFAEFREAIDASKIDAVLIHAVYLLNCASEDKEIRDKSLASLIQSLRVGDGHPRGRRGAAPRVGQAGRHRQGDHPRRQGHQGGAGRDRASASCTSRTRPEPAARWGDRSRSSSALLDASGGDKRLGVCLDSCHLLSSGYEVRTVDGLQRHAEGVRPGGRAPAGWARCTSTTRSPRWAPTATATRSSARASSARRGAPPFLSEPRFEKLPCVLETGTDRRRAERRRRRARVQAAGSAG